MNRHNRWFPGMIGLGLLVILTVGLTVVFQRVPAPMQTGQEKIAIVEPTQTATQDVPPTSLPTDTPEPPTPTVAPLSTPVPTPVVTAIPTFAPPYIENVPDKPLQPFWIYYWKENEIWRIDNEGKDNELLLDTYKQINKLLTLHPVPGTDCCWSGRRVAVSPNGKKLALVVVDKDKPVSLDDFTFSIYMYDVDLRELQLISNGVQPIWSPDNQHIAFLNQGGVWIANLETKEVQELVVQNEDRTKSITEFTWSPDSKQIAFMYRKGSYQLLPEIWIANTGDKLPPTKLLARDKDYFIGGITWSPDGQNVLYLSSEGSLDLYGFHRLQNLWSVSLTSGASKQLTRDFFAGSYGILPYPEWIFLGRSYSLYDYTEQGTPRGDLWLLNLNSTELRRITASKDDLGVIGLSPDKAHLLIWHSDESLQIVSLVDGSTQDITIKLGPNYVVGGAK